MALMMFGCEPDTDYQDRQAPEVDDAEERMIRQTLDTIRERSREIARGEYDPNRAASGTGNGNGEDEAAVGSLPAGSHTVQVSAWSSEDSAQQTLENWRDRGFRHAFVTQHQPVDDGEVHYRVRLGYFDGREQAVRAARQVDDEYGTEAAVVQADADTWVRDARSFTVQVAARSDRQQADQLRQEWQERGYTDAYVLEHQTGEGATIYRVRLGAFPSRMEARNQLERVREVFDEDGWVTPYDG